MPLWLFAKSMEIFKVAAILLLLLRSFAPCCPASGIPDFDLCWTSQLQLQCHRGPRKGRFSEFPPRKVHLIALLHLFGKGQEARGNGSRGGPRKKLRREDGQLIKPWCWLTFRSAACLAAFKDTPVVDNDPSKTLIKSETWEPRQLKKKRSE